VLGKTFAPTCSRCSPGDERPSRGSRRRTTRSGRRRGLVRRNTGRGEQLVAAVAATVERLAVVPGASALVPGVVGRGEVRRALVAGFPYWLVFDMFDERLVIIALAHHSRDPTFWVSRL